MKTSDNYNDNMFIAINIYKFIRYNMQYIDTLGGAPDNLHSLMKSMVNAKKTYLMGPSFYYSGEKQHHFEGAKIRKSA